MLSSEDKIKESYKKFEDKAQPLTAQKRTLFSGYRKRLEAFKLKKVRQQISQE